MHQLVLLSILGFLEARPVAGELFCWTFSRVVSPKLGSAGSWVKVCLHFRQFLEGSAAWLKPPRLTHENMGQML